MSTPIFKLEITEDYKDLPLLLQKDKYLMVSFVKGGFRNADLKALNFVREFLKAVTLADIVKAGSRISIQAYGVIVGNGLRTGIKEWFKTPTKQEMAAYFITIWQSAINKHFINNCSHLMRLITNGKQLKGWLDQDILGETVGTGPFTTDFIVGFTTTMK